MKRDFTPWPYAALTVALMVLGCGPGLLEELDRVVGDPDAALPQVVSFATELTVDVSWSADEAADEYVLERALDSISPNYSEVYRGEGLVFTDASCVNQERYLYRLSKIKGTRSFGPWGPVMGVGSSTRNDALEPNDTLGEATPLEYDRIANLYFYRSYDGQIVQDTDWYSVEVPPRRQANIVVKQKDLDVNTSTTFMEYHLDSSVPVPVVNNFAFPIRNMEFEPKVFYFAICPNPLLFVSGPVGGGTTIDYTISLISITGL